MNTEDSPACPTSPGTGPSATTPRSAPGSATASIPAAAAPRAAGDTWYSGPVTKRTLGGSRRPRGRSVKPVPPDGAWQDGPVTLSANAARTGIDLAWVDAGIRPQDDLFAHVNGRWLATHEIPDDRAQDGAFVMLRDRAEADVRAIVEGAADAATDDARQIAALYASFMDVERVEALGVAPLQPLLDEIAARRDRAALAAVLGRRQREGRASLFGSFVSTDAKDPNRYLVHLNQSGLGLPDESYYREESYAEIRTAYVAHLERLAELVGLADPARLAESVMELETALAAASWDRVSNRDAEKTYTLHDGRRAARAGARRSPGTPGSTASARPEGAFAEIVVRQPSFVEAAATLWQERPLAQWQAWLALRTASACADYLSDAVVQRGLRLLRPHAVGHAADAERWKRGVRARGGRGRRGGRASSTSSGTSRASAKERMDDARREPRRGLPAEHLRRSTGWARPPASGRWRSSAKFTPKIGYPDKWEDYSALEVRADDLLGNVLRAGALAHRPRARQDRQAGRPRRVVHDPADGQRLLPPAAQRDRVPGRDPAAAVLRPRRRRRGQLRRHRRGDRARDRPRLRRPGQQVRRRRRHDRLVGRRRPGRVRPPRQGAHRPVLRRCPRRACPTTRSTAR